jgi:hypothetical protein
MFCLSIHWMLATLADPQHWSYEQSYNKHGVRHLSCVLFTLLWIDALEWYSQVIMEVYF